MTVFLWHSRHAVYKKLFFITLALTFLQHFTFLLNSRQKELTKLSDNRKLYFQNKQRTCNTSKCKQQLTAQLYCCKYEPCLWAEY